MSPLEDALASACLPRSPAVLDDLIDSEHVLQAKYQPHDADGDGHTDTFCNKFAQAIAIKSGTPIPEVRANDLAVWFIGRDAASKGWGEVNRDAAKEKAAKGEIIFILYFNPKGHPGHIAVMRPDGSIAQAGGHNYERGTLAQCFGNLPVRYHHHL